MKETDLYRTAGYEPPVYDMEAIQDYLGMLLAISHDPEIDSILATLTPEQIMAVSYLMIRPTT